MSTFRACLETFGPYQIWLSRGGIMRALRDSTKNGYVNFSCLLGNVWTLPNMGPETLPKMRETLPKPKLFKRTTPKMKKISILRVLLVKSKPLFLLRSFGRHYQKYHEKGVDLTKTELSPLSMTCHRFHAFVIAQGVVIGGNALIH